MNRGGRVPCSACIAGAAILGFGSRILGVELLNTFRENVDYLLIGRFIGMKALGVYYFAFNAGLGLSLSVINALGVSLYSDLCASRLEAGVLRERFDRNLTTIAKVVVPLVALQASLSPLYVPIVFGQKWVDQGAVPILVVICLSALSRPFANAASMLFRSIGLPQVDLWWNLAFTLSLTRGGGHRSRVRVPGCGAGRDGHPSAAPAALRRLGAPGRAHPSSGLGALIHGRSLRVGRDSSPQRGGLSGGHDRLASGSDLPRLGGPDHRRRFHRRDAIAGRWICWWGIPVCG